MVQLHFKTELNRTVFSCLGSSARKHVELSIMRDAGFELFRRELNMANYNSPSKKHHGQRKVVEISSASDSELKVIAEFENTSLKTKDKRSKKKKRKNSELLEVTESNVEPKGGEIWINEMGFYHDDKRKHSKKYGGSKSYKTSKALLGPVHSLSESDNEDHHLSNEAQVDSNPSPRKPKKKKKKHSETLDNTNTASVDKVPDITKKNQVPDVNLIHVLSTDYDELEIHSPSKFKKKKRKKNVKDTESFEVETDQHSEENVRDISASQAVDNSYSGEFVTSKKKKKSEKSSADFKDSHRNVESVQVGNYDLLEEKVFGFSSPRKSKKKKREKSGKDCVSHRKEVETDHNDAKILIDIAESQTDEDNGVDLNHVSRSEEFATPKKKKNKKSSRDSDKNVESVEVVNHDLAEENGIGDSSPRKSKKKRREKSGKDCVSQSSEVETNRNDAKILLDIADSQTDEDIRLSRSEEFATPKKKKKKKSSKDCRDSDRNVESVQGGNYDLVEENGIGDSSPRKSKKKRREKSGKDCVPNSSEVETDHTDAKILIDIADSQTDDDMRLSRSGELATPKKKKSKKSKKERGNSDMNAESEQIIVSENINRDLIEENAVDDSSSGKTKKKKRLKSRDNHAVVEVESDHNVAKNLSDTVDIHMDDEFIVDDLTTQLSEPNKKSKEARNVSFANTESEINQNSINNFIDTVLNHEDEIATFDIVQSTEDENCEETDPLEDYEMPFLHQVTNSNRQLTLERVKEFRAQGIPVKTSRFTPEEDRVLKKNMRRFRKRYDISKENFAKYLGINCFADDESKGSSRLSRRKARDLQLIQYLGRGLPHRTLFAIYRRARLLVPMKTRYVHMSQEETKTLLNLIELHGCKFNKISKIMEVPPTRLRDRYRYLQHREKGQARGYWSDEENKLLLEALKKVLGVTEDELRGRYTNIPWHEVAKLVPGRTAHQCNYHWVKSFRWKIPKHKRQSFSKRDTIRYLDLIRNSGVQHEEEIDWGDIAKQFDEKTSYYHVRKLWSTLKSLVPSNILYMELDDYLDFFDQHFAEERAKLALEPNLETDSSSDDDDDDDD